MQRFAQYLMILAVVLFTASPIVDCCLSGHAVASMDEPSPGISADLSSKPPPCHGGGGDSSVEPTAPADDAGCGGCVNCDSAIVHAGEVASDGISLADHDVKLVPVVSKRPDALTKPATFLATGPPRASPRAATTPLSLKQRLLI